ncbi:hypothetical protein D9M70_383850 [compost metagenome]
MVKVIRAAFWGVVPLVVGTLLTLYLTREVVDSFLALAWYWLTVRYFPTWVVLLMLLFLAALGRQLLVDGAKLSALQEGLDATRKEADAAQRELAAARREVEAAKKAAKEATRVADEAQRATKDQDLDGLGLPLRPITLEDVQRGLTFFEANEGETKALLALAEIREYGRRARMSAIEIARHTTFSVLVIEQSLESLVEKGLVLEHKLTRGPLYELSPVGREWALARRKDI